MTTWTTLLKEMLKKRKDFRKDKQPQNNRQETETNQQKTEKNKLLTENKTQQTTKNLERNERKDYEISGHPGVDNTVSGKNPGDDQANERERRAYERGLIDGRNSRIEERYFPKEDDGIPEFHGSPSKEIKTGDIFRIARDA